MGKKWRQDHDNLLFAVNLMLTFLSHDLIEEVLVTLTLPPRCSFCLSRNLFALGRKDFVTSQKSVCGGDQVTLSSEVVISFFFIS